MNNRKAVKLVSQLFQNLGNGQGVSPRGQEYRCLRLRVLTPETTVLSGCGLLKGDFWASLSNGRTIINDELERISNVWLVDHFKVILSVLQGLTKSRKAFREGLPLSEPNIETDIFKIRSRPSDNWTAIYGRFFWTLMSPYILTKFRQNYRKAASWRRLSGLQIGPSPPLFARSINPDMNTVTASLTLWILVSVADSELSNFLLAFFSQPLPCLYISIHDSTSGLISYLKCCLVSPMKKWHIYSAFSNRILMRMFSRAKKQHEDRENFIMKSFIISIFDLILLRWTCQRGWK
jgi:hypothetical protein